MCCNPGCARPRQPATCVAEREGCGVHQFQTLHHRVQRGHRDPTVPTGTFQLRAGGFRCRNGAVWAVGARDVAAAAAHADVATMRAGASHSVTYARRRVRTCAASARDRPRALLNEHVSTLACSLGVCLVRRQRTASAPLANLSEHGSPTLSPEYRPPCLDLNQRRFARSRVARRGFSSPEPGATNAQPRGPPQFSWRQLCGTLYHESWAALVELTACRVEIMIEIRYRCMSLGGAQDPSDTRTGTVLLATYFLSK